MDKKPNITQTAVILLNDYFSLIPLFLRINKHVWIILLFFVFFYEITEAQELHPVKDNIACLWGLKNDSSRWVIVPKYTQLEKNYRNFFLVMYNDQWGVLGLDGKELIPLVYDRLNPIVTYSSGPYGNTSFYKEFAATKGKEVGLIDLTGKILIPFKYDAIWKDYNEDYFYITRHSKRGLRTYEKEIFPCVFPFLKKIGQSDLFVVGSSETYSGDNRSYIGLNIGVVNLQGDTVIPCRYNYIKFPGEEGDYAPSKFSFGNDEEKKCLIAVYLQNKIGLYTLEGKSVMEPLPIVEYVNRYIGNGDRFESIYSYGEPNYYFDSPLVFTENGKFGIVTPGKGIIQPAVFDSIDMQMPHKERPGFYRVKQDGKAGILNADGSMLLTCKFEHIRFYTDHIFVSTKDDHFREFNWRTKKTEKRVYQRILPMRNEFIDLISDNTFYSNYNDATIHACKILARLPGNITVINPGDGIEGNGVEARRIQIKGIRFNNSHFLSIQTNKGQLICSSDYRVIVSPGVYTNFYEMYDSPNIVVISPGGKVGMIDTAGKLVVDTVFEAIGNFCVNNRIFVKPFQPLNKLVTGHCTEGWALADSTGKLLTEPILSTSSGISKYKSTQFLMTNEGIGVFNSHELKFITATTYRNGFFTGDGGFILQTKTGLFHTFSFEGKQLGNRSWKGLLHLSGNRDVRRESPAYNFKGDSLIRDLTNMDDAWLLMDGDSLAILNSGSLICDRRTVLRMVYNYFAEASALDPIGSSDDYYNSWGRKPVDIDCPRLDTGSESGFSHYYNFIPVQQHTMVSSPKDSDSLIISDSLVLRMIKRLAPRALYPFHPNYEYECYCFAAKYNAGKLEFKRDPRGVSIENNSAYYRVVYRNTSLISLQRVYNFHYFGSSINKKYSNKSIFENYSIVNGVWKPIQFSELFKPGYENLVLSEIALAIQKNETLEMDCHNPKSYLALCGGRFNFSQKGLLVYMENNNSYEYIPLLIPWNRLQSVIPKSSAAYGFIKKSQS